MQTKLPVQISTLSVSSCVILANYDLWGPVFPFCKRIIGRPPNVLVMSKERKDVQCFTIAHHHHLHYHHHQTHANLLRMSTLRNPLFRVFSAAQQRGFTSRVKIPLILHFSLHQDPIGFVVTTEGPPGSSSSFLGTIFGSPGQSLLSQLMALYSSSEVDF